MARCEVGFRRRRVLDHDVAVDGCYRVQQSPSPARPRWISRQRRRRHPDRRHSVLLARRALSVSDPGGDQPKRRFGLVGGETIAMSFGSTSWSPGTPDWPMLELTPERRLDPNTAYTVRASWTSAAQESMVVTSSFMTGEGPEASVPTPPIASVQTYDLGANLNSCGSLKSGTCVSFPAGVVVQWTGIDQFGQDGPAGLSHHPFFTDLADHGPQAINVSCLKLRTRSANGTLSDVTTLCASDGPHFQLPSGSPIVSCTPTGLVQDGMVVTHDAPLPPSAAVPAPKKSAGRSYTGSWCTDERGCAAHVRCAGPRPSGSPPNRA
jgi:hypothetical protein